MIHWRLAAAALTLAGGSALAAAAGDPAPQPPCGDAAPVPPYASPGAEPTMESWSRIQWHPPACLDWPDTSYKHVIALAARIDAADAAQLLRRLGAVSSSRGLRYWSVTENAWRVLIEDSAALTGIAGSRRGDFDAAEMQPGTLLYFAEKDNRSSSPVVYAMRVREASAGRIMIETENATPIEAALITLFPPKTLRAAYIMTRLDDHTWAFYAISAATGGASGLVAMAKASYENRARALFGHFAGRDASGDGRKPSP
jgi:hypothetical protein